MRYTYVRQHDSTDCAAASLAMVSLHYKKEITITRLREMACGISSPSWEEKVQTSRNTDAPFVRCLEKIMDLEKVVNSKIDTLVDLKRQIRTTVDTVANVNERMVLRYRYIHNMTWEQIGGELNADESTIRRWHKAALSAVVVPDDPIRI